MKNYKVEFSKDGKPLNYREEGTAEWIKWNPWGSTPMDLVMQVHDLLVYENSSPNNGEYPMFYFPDSRVRLFKNIKT